ncbi:hypothetical protein N9J15_02650 [Porticoccaceae bacterium]|nr:hypothetical protein [Porticoccaceae bacterium]
MLKNTGRQIYVGYLLASFVAIAWISWEQASFNFFGISIIGCFMWSIVTIIVVMFHSLVVNSFISLKNDIDIIAYDIIWMRNFLIVFLAGINLSIAAFILELPAPYSVSFMTAVKFIFLSFFLSGLYGVYRKLITPSEKFFLGIRAVDEED